MNASRDRNRRRICQLSLALISISGLAATQADAQSDQATIGYLGHLHCHQTTSGTDIPFLDIIDEATRGSDNLRVAYGVFVMYRDGSYRTWGDRIYSSEVDSGFRLAAMINTPLFIHRPNPPTVPSEIDITTPYKTVEWVRVAIVLFESDHDDFKFPARVETHGLGLHPITDKLRNYPWRSFIPQMRTQVDRQPTQLAEAVFWAARNNNNADVIGYNEFKFTTENLQTPFKFTQIATAAEVESQVTAPPDGGLRKFHNYGHDSNYRGSFWMVRGPVREMEQLLLRDPAVMTSRYARRNYVMLTNRKSEAVGFTLTPIGSMPRRELVDEGGEPILDRWGRPLISNRNTVSMVLGAGQSRVFSLDSAEDEVYLYFYRPAPPEDTEFFAAPALQRPFRLRHGDAYTISESGDGQMSNAYWWNQIPPRVLPYHVNRQLERMRKAL